MKKFLIISAVLAWLFGVFLLFFPDKFYAPTGIAMTSLVSTIAQAHAATLIGLGFVNWFSRNLKGENVQGILLGNLVVQILSLIVVVRTMLLGPGLALLPGVVIHVVLGSCFGYFAVKNSKAK